VSISKKTRFASIGTTIICISMITLPAAHSTSRHTSLLNVVEHATTDDIRIHGGSAADNIGDVVTFTNDIYNSSNTKRLGQDHGFCIRLAVGKSMECHWTLMLPEGQIIADGPVFDHTDTLMAVTGGTGEWVGARGEVSIHARDPKNSSYDFHYRLLQLNND